ncbi:hypothetical protein ACFZDK_45675 [Streptomyces sp. NPDC007901]|uniref:hypothetical protein n=1 Tax=Streptomyces sp. NPDC007901 TaxID=3364785 RepID=UPI0036DFB6A8
MHPLAVEQNFRMRADRLQGWGIGLLVCAFLFWAYAAWEVFTPYTSTHNAVDCSSPFNSEPRDLYFEDSEIAHEKALQCASDRDWPAPLAALVLSVPLSGVGVALFTTARVSVRLREHDDELRRAEN